jgi:hypothetical protein
MSRAPGEDQRRADALRAGGALAHLTVGDQARALLAGGHWIDGPFHLVNSVGSAEGSPTHWVTVSGDVIPVAAVAVVRLARNPRVTKFVEEVDDITGRNRCPGSGQPAGEVTDADGPVGYCRECESEVPAPGGRYIDHDLRGRYLHSAE